MRLNLALPKQNLLKRLTVPFFLMSLGLQLAKGGSMESPGAGISRPCSQAKLIPAPFTRDGGECWRLEEEGSRR